MDSAGQDELHSCREEAPGRTERVALEPKNALGRTERATLEPKNAPAARNAVRFQDLPLEAVQAIAVQADPWTVARLAATCRFAHEAVRGLLSFQFATLGVRASQEAPRYRLRLETCLYRDPYAHLEDKKRAHALRAQMPPNWLATFPGVELVPPEGILGCFQVSLGGIRALPILPGVSNLSLIDCRDLVHVPAECPYSSCHFHRCGSLARLPPMPNLSHAQFHTCERLGTVETQPGLEHLTVLCCDQLEALETQPRLQTLEISFCDKFAALEGQPDLATLKIENCSLFGLMPRLANLTRLILRNCDRLETLCGRGEDLPRVRLLSICDCARLTALPPLPRVRSLTVVGCPALVSIPALPRVRSLTVVGCPALVSIPALPRAHSLSVKGCPGVASLPAELLCLATLRLSGAPLVAVLPSMPVLDEADISFCDGFEVLPEFPAARRVSVRACNFLSAFPFQPAAGAVLICGCERLASLAVGRALRELVVEECPVFSTLGALSGCEFEHHSAKDTPGLSAASFHRAKRVSVGPSQREEEPNTHPLRRLTSLSLEAVAVTSLPSLPALQVLRLCNVPLARLPSVPAIESVRVLDCGLLADVSGASGTRGLELRRCPRVESLPDLPSVEWMNLSQVNLRALPRMPRVQALDVYECRRIVPPFPEFPSLSRASFKRCGVEGPSPSSDPRAPDEVR